MLERAQKLAEGGDYEAAWDILKVLLEGDPHDPHALLAAAYVMQRVNNYPVAYHFANQAVQGLSNRAEPWLNVAEACDVLGRVEEGLLAAEQAIKLADTDKLRAIGWQNYAAILINSGRFKDAEEACFKALEYNPTHPKALGNLGMVQLSQGQWKDGWQNYSKCLGTNARVKQDCGLPEWDGEKGTVLVYGEQGIGDEISFASMIPDLLKTNPVVCVSAPKLQKLFDRSFGRGERPTHQIAVGELGRFFRNKNEDFPRTPYLKPDPDRVEMWKALFYLKKKPVVGIAWTGGLSHTNAKTRQLSSKQLQKLIGKLDAHVVSLEYKPRKEIQGVNVYPYGTLTDDYDDTAAMVACCDLVITMQTAVAHLAGALGVPCWVMVPETSQWRYGPSEMLWYGENFKIYRKQGDWDQLIERIGRDFRSLSGRAKKAA